MLAINPSFGADEAQKQAAEAVQFPAGSYNILTVSLTNDEDENKVNNLKLVYFDMTDAYKKLGKSKDRQTREKIKELKNNHQPMSEKELMEKLERGTTEKTGK